MYHPSSLSVHQSSIYLSTICLSTCVLKALMENLVYCQFWESLINLIFHFNDIVIKIHKDCVTVKLFSELWHRDPSFLILSSASLFLFHESQRDKGVKEKWRWYSTKWNEVEFGKQNQNSGFLKITWNCMKMTFLKMF